METKISPLAPKSFPEMPAIEGVRFATAEAGVKYQDRTDVLLAVFDRGTNVAGVLTGSKCAAAPVEWCRGNLPGGLARALVVNSGNANAFTGDAGRQAVHQTANAVAEIVGCDPNEVFLSSTGVIGEPLPANKITDVLSICAARLAAGPWLDAAQAITTTDTYPKIAAATLELDGIEISIAGIAKGSGMIAPDMATMLAYVFTDMPISASLLQGLISKQVRTSFNAITVDSDTSTSDTVLAFATNRAGLRGVAPIIFPDDPRLDVFALALENVLFDLAMQIVRDGEGATKLVTITVQGAQTDASAHIVAKSIANSPLVKTAIAGEDANWGRVVMAIGKAGEPADRDKVSIWFGAFLLAEKGERTRTYDEAAVSAYMQNAELDIRVDLGIGDGQAKVYTCDLTHGYININADYRS